MVNMGRNSCQVEACEECNKRCIRFHRNKEKSSPVIDSFFKVIIGNDHSEVLFLPPKFAQTVSALIGKGTVIEDSSGGCWEVTVSKVDGSPAFQQGWNAFSLHHRLEIGDFLIFDYIEESRFLVKIYDKTGCEKQNLSLNTDNRKRARTAQNSTDRDGQCCTTGKDSMSKHSSRTSVFSGSDVEMSPVQCEVHDVEVVNAKITSNRMAACKRPRLVPRAECLEDPYYLLDRDFGDQQREDRHSVFDLSHFEMVDNNRSMDKCGKVMVAVDYPHHTGASLRSEFEDMFVNKYPVDKVVENRVAAFDASYLEIMKNNVQKMSKMAPCPEIISCNGKISENLPSTTAVEVQKTGGNSSIVLSALAQKCHGAEEESKAPCKSQKEVDGVMVSTMECDQNAQLKFVGKFRESSVQVMTGMRNHQFVELQKNGGSSSNSSSGVSKKCYGAEEECKAELKLQTGIHQMMVSEMKCSSLNDNKQSPQLKFVGQFAESSVPVTAGEQSCQFGECKNFVNKEPLNIVKKEPVEIVKIEPGGMLEDTFGNLPELFKGQYGQHFGMTVKTDAMDFVCNSSLSAADISCLTPPEGQPFLGKASHAKEDGGPP